MPADDRPPALHAAIAAALDHRRRSSTLRRLTLAPSHSVDFSSNDFLSLSTSHDLRRRYLDELASRPDFPLGSGGSRLLDGNTTYAESIEGAIASFHHAPSALLATSGFDANVAIFATLPQPGDVVLYDELIHASVHDGMRASRVARTNRLAFRHNDVEAFASVLQHVIAHVPALTTGRASLFVAVEAVYSMDGDLAPLTELVSTLDRLAPPALRQNTHFVVDEAHATGVLGPQGRGLVCALGLEHRIAVRLHTFGKALAANGAAILCAPDVKHYLLNYARPLIYTTFLSFPALALVRAAYTLMSSGATDPLATRLQANVHLLWTELRAAAAASRATSALIVPPAPTAPPRSAIFSIETPRPRALAAACQRAGYLVRPIMPPTVPAGRERVRVCLHAANTEAEIRGLVAAVVRWCEESAAADEAAAAANVEMDAGVRLPAEAERAKL